MKATRLIGFIFFIAFLTLLSGCGGTIEVLPANVYAETETGTAFTPEITGQRIDGSTWFRIDGTFNSSSDSDSFEVAIAPGVTSVNIHVFHNGEEVTSGFLTGINLFPLTVYDGVTNFINAASGGVFEPSAASGTIEMTVYAVASTLFGSPLPYTSGTYSVEFQ